jgi:hypothetical protein
MAPKKIYNLFVVLFPVIYLLHNLEEWIVFDSKVSKILLVIPDILKEFIPNDLIMLSFLFSLALIVATLIPLIVSISIFGEINLLRIKILLVIAFVTLINAISHITSSIALGFFSPGFITGSILCIPYSIALILFIRKQFEIEVRQYLFIGFGSIAIYILGVTLSWAIGVLIISI